MWVRLYTEITRDRKIRRLDPALRWLWVTLICISKESPEPGKLLITDGVHYAVEDIADEADLPVDEVSMGLKEFMKLKMLGLDKLGCYYLLNWDKRQFSSDNSTERVQKYREKKKQQCNVSETPPETDTETETECINNYNDTRTREAEIVPTLEKEFGRLPSPTEVERLEHFTTQGMDSAVVCEAIKRARLHGKPQVAYTEAILKNWHSAGVINMPGIERLDKEHEQAKQNKGSPGSNKKRGSPSDFTKKDKYADIYMS